VHAAPGNGGIEAIGKVHPVDVNDPAAITALAKSIGASLVVLGPEAPLVAGAVDALREAGIAAFGPDAAAARLEGSKIFSKEFMARHGIPTAGFRIFDDAEGVMNRSAADEGAELLVVSQFTLYGDLRSGNRPGFSRAAPPEQAERLYLAFADALRAAGVPVQTGRFGAVMEVELVNDGPVTLWLDSGELFA